VARLGLGVVMMLALWGAIAVAVWAIARSSPGREDRNGGPDAEEILRERFARGEIGEEEFRTRRDALAGMRR
jgi:putative membrane protein